jgi:hypothetical protein
MDDLTKFDNNIQKKAVVEAYIKSFGNVSTTCKSTGITRQTFYNWLKNDEDFKTAIENSGAEDYFLDFLESKLTEKINSGDTTCIIFALKTKAKKRGYIERSEVDFNLMPKMEISVLNDTAKNEIDKLNENE